jgi:hypothetical protein
VAALGSALIDQKRHQPANVAQTDLEARQVAELVRSTGNTEAGGRPPGSRRWRNSAFTGR